jgi:hypothetical protein
LYIAYSGDILLVAVRSISIGVTIVISVAKSDLFVLLQDNLWVVGKVVGREQDQINQNGRLLYYQ